jgi:hypothetical protein
MELRYEAREAVDESPACDGFVNGIENAGSASCDSSRATCRSQSLLRATIRQRAERRKPLIGANIDLHSGDLAKLVSGLRHTSPRSWAPRRDCAHVFLHVPRFGLPMHATKISAADTLHRRLFRALLEIRSQGTSGVRNNQEAAG